jgi:hypothetical protein
VCRRSATLVSGEVGESRDTNVLARGGNRFIEQCEADGAGEFAGKGLFEGGIIWGIAEEGDDAVEEDVWLWGGGQRMGTWAERVGGADGMATGESGGNSERATADGADEQLTESVCEHGAACSGPANKHRHRADLR